MNRQDDLMNVFDKTWKANHNDDVKRAKENEKKFMDKMFNTGSKNVIGKVGNTPLERVNNLNNNIDNARRGFNQNKINGIVGKFK